MNFYEALNLTPSATLEEIEEAYRTLALKVHPDLNRHDPTPAEARMKLLNRIRETLSNPACRAEYDRKLADGADSARLESAIDETIRGSRNDALFWRQVKLTTLAGLGFGLLLGSGSWFLDVMRARKAEPAPTAVGPIELPAPTVAPPMRKAMPALAPRKTKSGPEVVEFGSSTEDVLQLLGKPDRVEEVATQRVRILHYGKLRLVFNDNKLVPGSGIKQER